MSVVVVEPRGDDLLVPMDLVRKHLRVDHDEEDDLIELHVRAIESWLDGPEGWLGRCLGPQVLRLVAAPCASGTIVLPLGPVSEIVSVGYGMGDDVVDAGVYELDANRVRLGSGNRWPSAGPLTVDYKAGYEPATLPKAIQAAILLMVGDLYAFRETAMIGTVSTDIKVSATAKALLSPFRVRRV